MNSRKLIEDQLVIFEIFIKTYQMLLNLMLKLKVLKDLIKLSKI